SATSTCPSCVFPEIFGGVRLTGASAAVATLPTASRESAPSPATSIGALLVLISCPPPRIDPLHGYPKERASVRRGRKDLRNACGRITQGLQGRADPAPAPGATGRPERSRVRLCGRRAAGHHLAGRAHLRPAVGRAGEALAREDRLLRERAARFGALRQAELGKGRPEQEAARVLD